jgi:hypothetical protein
MGYPSSRTLPLTAIVPALNSGRTPRQLPVPRPSRDFWPTLRLCS